MRHPQVSFLVPFRQDNNAPERVRVWTWLQEYWSWEMPDAEIVIGQTSDLAFSKTKAVDDAARNAHGRIFVILDSDTYMRGEVIQHCATAIEEAARKGNNLWFIPYRHLYRLTQSAANLVLESDPRDPYRFHHPPPPDAVERAETSGYGHRFGAMIQIMPREAFEEIGGMDPRFEGWGGEDVALVRAVDTLWGKHKTTNNQILHLWHPNIGDTAQTRMWSGQDHPQTNNQLSTRYGQATGNRAMMRDLVNEYAQP